MLLSLLIDFNKMLEYYQLLIKYIFLIKKNYNKF